MISILVITWAPPWPTPPEARTHTHPGCHRSTPGTRWLPGSGACGRPGCTQPCMKHLCLSWKIGLLWPVFSSWCTICTLCTRLLLGGLFMSCLPSWGHNLLLIHFSWPFRWCCKSSEFPLYNSFILCSRIFILRLFLTSFCLFSFYHQNVDHFLSACLPHNFCIDAVYSS